MKQLIYLSCILALSGGSAHAACYADYKAKQDDPLRLHYGVAEISGDCATDAAAASLAARLQEDGWQLLTVLSVFDDATLEGKRESAGDYFLRY
jgi:predicted PhzF superfamily epimerase YddE/YHI9